MRKCCRAGIIRATGCDSRSLYPGRGKDLRHLRDRRLGAGRSRRRRCPDGSGRGRDAGWRSTSARASSTGWISSPSFARPLTTRRFRSAWSRVEFTESAAMEVSETVLAEIAALRDDGATISIDDFGTGYSNLARLRAMPLGRVKLDPSLIADIDTCRKGPRHRPSGDPTDQGRRVRDRRRAVETVAQADILRAMGCDTVQGYVFAAPMFEAEFPRVDRQRRPQRARSRSLRRPSLLWSAG